MTNIIDSDVLIDVGAQHPVAIGALDRLGSDSLACSILSYGEIFEGVLGARDFEATVGRFERLMRLLTILDVTIPILNRFAEIRRELRRTGLLIGDFDIVIAATAIEHDLRLITRNRRHFERIPGLRFNSPEEVLGE